MSLSSIPTLLLLLLQLLLVLISHTQGIFIEDPRNVTYLPGLTPLPIELTCNIINGFPIWQVNGTSYRVDQLDNGELLGHSRNESNILVNSPMNNTEYICVFQTINGSILLSDPAYIIIAGNPGSNCNPSVEPSFLNRSNVTVTLKWIEPFTNFNSIENYTVSWNDSTFSSFATTNGTARSYTITNLIAMTNYMFSVVATNSVGSGNPCVLFNNTPPAIDKVTGVNLSCEAMDFNNTCNVTWNPVIGDITEYEVNYNGTMKNVTSPNTTLPFVAPSVPDNRFSDMVAVTVTAYNKLGVGPPSSLKLAPIYGSSIANVTVTGTFNVTTQLTNINSTKDVYVSYLIDVTDIILLNTSNMTHVFFGEILFSTMSGVVLSPGDNFTSSGLGIKFSVVGANVTRDAIADMFNVAVDADMFNVTVDRIEEEYNITVACNIYPESMANMCMVVAMGINSSTMPGSASISNNMANVMLTGLNCNKKYTIIAGGIFFNGSLVGPKSIEGTIFESACDTIVEFVRKIFDESLNDKDRGIAPIAMNGCTGCIVGIVFGVLILIVIIATLIDLYRASRESEKTTCNQIVKWILFIASLGLGFLIWRMYLYCHRREGVKPNEVVEMKDSTDLYASPKKKENVDVDPKQQELYSYARTGPINVVVPGEKP